MLQKLSDALVSSMNVATGLRLPRQRRIFAKTLCLTICSLYPTFVQILPMTFFLDCLTIVVTVLRAAEYRS